ncbi:MAG TPA: PadR family transcriptional regulator [Stellaceae bacterium]|nr:PadR family transcriptional regulator [Stellaceae bacterium]
MPGHRHEHDHRRQMRGMFGSGSRRAGGRHGHGLRGGRRDRFFDQGDLRYVLLHLIAERPRHGYELIKAIEDKFGGMYSPSPGVIYPTLTLLEELGHIRPAEGEGARKAYAVTEEGTAFLAANRAAVDQVLERMAAAAAAFGGGPAPEILRAMHNLRLALRIRLGRGPLDAAQVRAVTDILDRAAAEVERL